MSYAALIGRVATRPHPNADRLQLGDIYGHQVVIGRDVEDGALGIFFPSDGQIQDSFLRANDLYPRIDPEDGSRKGGFFDERTRRVRAQSFRGQKSDGYWCSIDALFAWIDHLYTEKGPLKSEPLSLSFYADLIQGLKEGDTLEALGAFPLCNKYFTPATLNARANAQQVSRKKNPHFAEHADTKQFLYELDRIPAGSIIHITEKLHGTSGRFGKVIDTEPPRAPGAKGLFLSFLFWALLRFGYEVQKPYVFLLGTRRTVKEMDSYSPDDTSGYYGNDGFRYKVGQKLRSLLNPGEVVYGEHVGWAGPETTIMPRHNPSKVSKELVKKYGDQITYSYGAREGASDFYIYRITKVDSSGEVVELSTSQYMSRAHNLGFKTPPLLHPPFVFTTPEKLGVLVQSLMEGDSIVDPSHPREGVIVRVDAPDGDTYWLKAKSHDFKVMEGIVKDADVVDMEEAA